MHVRRENGRIRREEEGNADYGIIVQPSQQHVVPCVRAVEWGLGRRGLRIVAAFLGQHPTVKKKTRPSLFLDCT